MNRAFRLTALAVLLVGNTLLAQNVPLPPPKVETFWNMDDVHAGMKGQGRSVIKGTKIETFDAEVIGVLKNTSPGRDLVLCKLAGMNLEKTGVIQGMSGSPIYIDGKLLGAVAYAWAYGTEPIAGVTPFSQMQSFAAAYENGDPVGKQNKPARIGLAKPILLDGRSYRDVMVAEDYREPQAASADGMWMIPLKTPVMTTGMSARSLAVMREHFQDFGLVPMQGGAAAANIPAAARDVRIEPGSALSVALITGDFDMSAIGTVTHVDGKRVYGFGHPFMGVGRCELPLMTGYTHTIFPRLSLSFKMGSPLKTVGVINADTSTCIAGWLDREPDLLPLSASIRRGPDGKTLSYHVKIVRLRNMLGALVHTALTNSVDMEGNFPDEMSAHVKARIEIEGHEPLVLDDWFAGPMFTGDRAPQMLYAPVGMMLQQLTGNSFESLRFKSIDCITEVEPGRRTADIDASELESDTLAPGETLKAWITLRPFKGQRVRVPLEVKLPADLPEGNYTALVGDDLNNARMDLRDNPQLASPQTMENQFEMIRLQLAAKRTNLVLRVPLSGASGITIHGKTLPNLPPSMVQILSSSKRTGSQTLYSALVARVSTNYVIQGSDTLRFQVTKNKRGS